MGEFPKDILATYKDDLVYNQAVRVFGGYPISNMSNEEAAATINFLHKEILALEERLVRMHGSHKLLDAYSQDVAQRHARGERLERSQRRANIGGVTSIVGALMTMCAVFIAGVAVSVPAYPYWLNFVVFMLAVVGIVALFVGLIVVLIAAIKA